MPPLIIVLWTIVTLSLIIATLLFYHRQKKIAHDLQHHDQTQKELLNFLHDLGLSATPEISSHQLHRRCVRGLMTVLQSDSGALYLHQPQRRSLSPAWLSSTSPPLFELSATEIELWKKQPKAFRRQWHQRPMPDHEGLLGEVFSQQRTWRSNDLRLHPSFQKISSPLSPTPIPTLIAPLISGQKNLGLIVLTRHPGAEPFAPSSETTLRILAEQVAFALTNVTAQNDALAKRKIEEELTRASEIQRILLPQNPPAIDGYSLAASCQPATVVSGDYYDFIPVDADHWGLVIADVSGKGIGASLVMATCRSLLRALAPGELSPAATLSKVNRLLFSDIREDMFVSLAYLIFHPTSGTLTLARAGHDPLYLYRADSQQIETLAPPGLALGIDRGPVFDVITKDATLHLNHGDTLLCYTDGATEALDPTGNDEYTPEKLQHTFLTLAQSSHTDAPCILTSLQKSLSEFISTGRQYDDISFVILRRHLPTLTPPAN
jgi:phosphoserine phosphatase RsbU/P